LRILVDTNVVLDVLLDREPWSQTAAEIFARIERDQVEGLLGATTVTTIFYLARKELGLDTARQQVRRLLALFTVASVNRPVLEDAMAADFGDFEDAVLEAAARHAGADAIVTRDAKGFSASRLPVFSPSELAGALELRDSGTDADPKG